MRRTSMKNISVKNIMKTRFFDARRSLSLCISFLVLCSITRSASANLTGAGATFPYPLYSKWFDVYKHKTGVDIVYQSIGSGAGIRVFSEGTTDFAASDRILSPDEARRMKDDFVYLPTVAGSIAVVYNLKGVKQLKLSPQLLSAIYLGRITRWNDPRIAALNPQARLPATFITVMHRSDGNGATRTFRAYLQAASMEWKKQTSKNSNDWPVGMGGKGGDGVSSLIRQTAGAIGYVDWAYARQNQMSIAAIRNRAGQFVSPSVASTQAALSAFVPRLQKDVRASIVDASGAASYPICGLTYILVRIRQKDAKKAHQLRRFLRWAMDDGQKFAARLLYAPLPEALRLKNQEIISAIK